MIQFALIVSLSTLAAGIALALALRLAPTVRLQLAGLALLAVGLPLAAVILGGLVMFHMHEDVKILAVAAASACTALAAALLLGGRIAQRIRGLETAAEELSAGELKARAPTDGPSELAHVGEAFNAMAGNIEALFEPAASSSPGPATTCARPSPRSRRCSKRSTTASRPPTSTCRRCAARRRRWRP